MAECERDDATFHAVGGVATRLHRLIAQANASVGYSVTAAGRLNALTLRADL